MHINVFLFQPRATNFPFNENYKRKKKAAKKKLVMGPQKLVMGPQY